MAIKQIIKYRPLAALLLVFALSFSLGFSHVIEAAFAHCEDHCTSECESDCDLDCACINCIHSKLNIEVSRAELPAPSALLYATSTDMNNPPDQDWFGGIDRPPQILL